MRISTERNKLSLWLVGLMTTVFFGISAFLFYIYGISPALLVYIAAVAVYLRYFHRQKELPSYPDLLLLYALGIVIAVFTSIIFKLSPYYISAIGFVILITLLFNNLELSFIFSTFIALLSGGIPQGEMGYNLTVSLLCASLVAAMLSYRVRTRFKVIRAGFIAGVVQFLVAFLGEKGASLSIIGRPDAELLKICVLNGVISAGVVIGFLPVFEYIFHVVTNVSLLELSDFNHPLMKRMILEAPGTYQHSLVVANLAEAAAEAIGANPLLARIGAYYHDIGKIPKAHYFVENQIPYRDIHKDLKPSISKMIIINHVKEGVELAKKYRLNPRIIDFITQHHGRSLVYYFYHRAKELEPSSGNEEEYRYPGPRPQSKEVAIVSLADTIEALSRTLEDPTPSRIEEMVKNVVRKKFIEGELDESDLTLKDLEKISESFTRVLNAIFHTRINYPQDDSNKKSAKSSEDKPK